MSTRDSLRAATAAIGASEAMDKLARAMEPSPWTRALTLADHDCILANLEQIARTAANALLWEGRALADRDKDLGRLFGDAAGRCLPAERAAAAADQELRRELRHLGEDSPEARLNRTYRPVRAVLGAADAVADLANTLAVTRSSVAIHAQVAERFFQIITDLQGVFGYEATLMDWAYEEAGWGRKSSRVSGPLAGASFDLRNSARVVSIAASSLRDGVPSRRRA